MPQGLLSKKIISRFFFMACVLPMPGHSVFAEDKAATEKNSTVTNQEAFEVSVSMIKRESVRETMSAHAQILPHQVSFLNPVITGLVTEIKPGFEAGRRVKKGEVLVELDKTDFRYNLAKAKQTLAAAKLKLVEQEALSERAIAEWQAHNAKTPKGLAAREPQVVAAKAEIEAAELLVAQAERDLAATSVKSPFDGWVIKRNASEGNVVSAGTALAELIPADKVIVRLPLSNSQMENILSYNKGDQVNVELYSINSRDQLLGAFKGLSLGSMIEDKTGQIFAEAIVHVSPEEGMLRPGALLEARIYTGRQGDYFSIPQAAVNDKGNIFILKNNVITELAIEKLFGKEEFLVVDISGVDQVALVSTGVRQIWSGMPAYARIDRHE